jgi:CheY-like chemotaxis protein
MVLPRKADSAFKGLVHPMVEHNPSRHTILLIEPNRNLVRITRRALQDHGFVVTQVAAGGEALEVLGTQYPDAVVLDPDLTEELVQRGHDVTLFASGDSITGAKLCQSVLGS